MVVRISKNYIPNNKEKYMCAKHKEFFKKKLSEWKNEIIKSNNKALYLKETDENISSPDIIDQATSQTEKSVELRTINRQRKLVSKINSALESLNIKSICFGIKVG